MIFTKSRGIPLCVASLLLAASSSTTTAAKNNVIPAVESIAARIEKAHAAGDMKPRFILQAQRPGSETNYQVQVREAMPAVTSTTTTSVRGGRSIYVDEEDIATMLVSDEPDVVALIAVEKKGGKANGIVQRDAEKIKITQQNGAGAKTMATIAEAFDPPPWRCGYSPDTEGRSLFEDGHDDHDHSAHDHQDHSHDFDPSKTDDALANLKHSLRGSELRIGKRRRAQGVGYDYHVDVYVEIDFALCAANGETCANGIGTKTLNYVNALFTGANTIYETEINTHLHVLHIDLNTNYDSSTNTNMALDTMQTIFARVGGNWHYTSPSGVKPDLHHALLAKDLGGGIAFLGVICNSEIGFGLTANMNGNFVSMDNAVVWDSSTLMHEIGHNFGSGHTHDSDGWGYSPLIDTCGTSCPAGLPLAKSTTIMSYCDMCAGGESNLAYSFGGKYKGIGLRSDPLSYDNAVAGTISTNPRRVNAKMWQHVSSRGACTDVPPTIGAVMYTVPINNMALIGGQIRHYYMEVTTGQTVSCSTNGPNGDADLYMRFGDQAVPDSAFAGNACSSDSGTSMESCSTAAASAPTRVYAAVHAWSTFSGLTFQCTVSAAMYTAPINNMELTGGQIRHYYMEVTTGQTVSCSTNGPNGDADLYMRFGDQAIPDSAFAGNACSSDSGTSMESCSTAAASAPTRVYAAVHAWSTFSSLTFQCTVRAPTGSPTSARPTSKPTTRKPTTRKPTTRKPTTRKPTTRKPTTGKPI